MAIYAMEGFDASDAQLYWTTRYPTMVVAGGSVTAALANTRFASAGYALVAANTSWTMPLNANAAVATLGFYVKGNANGSFGATFRFRDAANAELCTFELTQVTDSSRYLGNTYSVSVSKASTPIATNRRRFRAYEEWVYHEIKVTFSATVGTFEGRYTNLLEKDPIAYTWDNATTGLNLGAGPCTNVVVTMASGNNSHAMYLDDLYVADDYLAAGPICIIGQWPVVAGATQDWTLLGGASVQACLGSGITKTIDTDRISSDAIGEIALTTLTARESLFGAGAALLAMRATFIARMDTSGSIELGHIWRNGSTNASTSSATFSGSTWTVKDEILLTDPTTAAPWVFADLDGLQAGIENLG